MFIRKNTLPFSDDNPVSSMMNGCKDKSMCGGVDTFLVRLLAFLPWQGTVNDIHQPSFLFLSFERTMNGRIDFWTFASLNCCYIYWLKHVVRQLFVDERLILRAMLAFGIGRPSITGFAVCLVVCSRFQSHLFNAVARMTVLPPFASSMSSLSHVFFKSELQHWICSVQAWPTVSLVSHVP